MSEDKNISEAEPRIWPHDRFVGKIIKAATSTLPIPISELPDVISLGDGKIGQHLNQLLAETLTDPHRYERGKVVKIGLDQKLHIPKENIVGGETQVDLSEGLSLVQRFPVWAPQYRQSEQVAFDMHSHGVADIPPSIQDLLRLIIPPEDNGTQAMIVVTETAGFLVMRTMETPETDRAVAEESLKARRDQIRNYALHLEKLAFTPDSRNKISAQKSMELVIEICRQYNLALYTYTTQDNRFIRNRI